MVTPNWSMSFTSVVVLTPWTSGQVELHRNSRSRPARTLNVVGRRGVKVGPTVVCGSFVDSISSDVPAQRGGCPAAGGAPANATRATRARVAPGRERARRSMSGFLLQEGQGPGPAWRPGERPGTRHARGGGTARSRGRAECGRIPRLFSKGRAARAAARQPRV